MNLLNLALRGLTRNRRRSLVTLMAIAFGFAAIGLFAGYTHNVYDGLTRQSIHGELLGHLTVSKRGMRSAGKLDPERYLFSAAEVGRLSELIRQERHVVRVAPRLSLSGLASNGRASTIFIADGIAPADMAALQQTEDARPGDLKRLDAAQPAAVLLSTGLIELLHLEMGGQAIFLANTLSGQANALDVTVSGGFNTGNAGSNDKYAFVPLALAQTLLDAEGRAERLTVLLDDVAHTEAIREHLAKSLRAAGYDVEVLTWQALSDFYRQVHEMFDMIFGFIFSIVLTVVVMSVANSMGMAVVERTREIGTLRAIGLKRSGVIALFAGESLLLAVLGCALGLLLTLLVRYGINLADIHYTPPNSAAAVPLLVDIDVARLSFTAGLMLLVGTLAAWLPARRAARQPIIDALGHV